MLPPAERLQLLLCGLFLYKARAQGGLLLLWEEVKVLIFRVVLVGFLQCLFRWPLHRLRRWLRRGWRWRGRRRSRLRLRRDRLRHLGILIGVVWITQLRSHLDLDVARHVVVNPLYAHLLQDLQGLLGPQAPQKRKGFVVQRQTTHLGLQLFGGVHNGKALGIERLLTYIPEGIELFGLLLLLIP